MPIMTRMRDNMPVILFGLLIAFLITIIFEWGMDYLGSQTGRGDVVGTINGNKITYADFTELVRNMAENQKAQTGAEPDETMMKQIRDQAWQSLVNQQLVLEEIQRLGITVTDQELIEWVRGDNPPEDLRQNFIDSLGTFRKDIYEQFLSNPNQFIQDPQGVDPNFGVRWLRDYEKNLRQRRSQEKLQSIILASVRVTDGEVRGRYLDQHQSLDALYALFDPNVLVKDDEVEVGDRDLRDHYEQNIDQFKFDATRKVAYVQFLEKASAADSALVQRDIESVADRARAGEDFLQLVSIYSQKPDSGTYFRHGELSGTLERPIFAAKVGDIVGPILDRDGYHLVKVLEERAGQNEYVHASHILLSLDAEKDSNEVKQLATQIARDARAGKDFAVLAKQYSKDPGSGERGGDLGWFMRGRMVKPFEDAAFRARPGEVVGPVRTQFGLHIIKVHARDARELKVASIIMPIEPSSQTRNETFDRARDFAYIARDGGFTKEAEAIGVELKEAQVLEGGVIPGLGMVEGAVRWAYKNKLGAVSEPFNIPGGYAVFTVAEIKDAGVRPFDEVKESIRPAVLRQKKVDKAKQLAAEARARLSPQDSLTRIKEWTENIEVRRTGSFTLSGSIPGIGRDQSFLGSVSGLSIFEVSPPVAGLRGVFLIQLLSRSEPDSAAMASQRENLRTQILQEKRNRYITAWLEQLKKDADIEDNREVFFR